MGVNISSTLTEDQFAVEKPAPVGFNLPSVLTEE